MGKKRKSRTSRRTTEILTEQAAAHLQAGRFREAVEDYKQLLKREPRPEWREALADAYLGRAGQLADKGMFKEAAALWENMAGTCGERQRECYLEWLLRAGREVRGARMFAEATEEFRASPAGRRIATRLAALLACGHEDLLEVLPVDSPLVRQREAVMTAMQAYCRGDDAALQAGLKTIPFRSPYRELRLLLQGLTALDKDPQVARSALEQITADSPLARFAELARSATLEGTALLEAVIRWPVPERDLTLTLKGWDRDRIELTGQLPDPRQASPKVLFQFAMRNADRIEATRLEPFCRALLPHHPGGIPVFEKHFRPLTDAERARIHALAAECRDDPAAALGHWSNCVESLLPPRSDTDDALEAALILRHMAELRRRLDGPDPWNEARWDELVRSLALDPDDKPTYLRLLEIARQRDDHKAQDYWIERAVERFPEDAEVLMAAGMAAYRRQSFKKAARFAAGLLERDPINPHARNLLISCHLGHARKQIKAGKHEPAERELAEAATHAREEDQHGIVALLQGFLALRRDAAAQAEERLGRGLAQLGGGLLARFRFLVEGQRLELPPQTLGRYYNRLQGEPPPASIEEVVRLAELLHRYLDDKVKALPRVLDKLRKPLRAAARLEFSEQEFEAICAAFHRVSEHGLLRDYAEAALERSGQQPRFFYYSVFGRAKGQSGRLTPLERMQLESVLDRALGDGDFATAERIEELLGCRDPEPLGMPPDLLEGFGQIMDDLMDQLNTDDPEVVLEFIEEQLSKEGLPPIPFPGGKPR